jgi:uncharacterized membrane-anchored protein YhcB (DUF1043 family)
MTWQAAAILVGGLLAIGGVIAYLFHRALARAERAERAAAAERVKTLDVQAREMRDAHLARTRPMGNDELVAEADALAERIRKDMERRGGR